MKNMNDFEKLMKGTFAKEEEYEEFKSTTEFIAKLVKARLDRGITQEKLAELTGLTQPTIAKIEKGSTIPRIDTIMRIISALGLNINLVSEIEKNSGSKITDSKIDELMSCIIELKNDISDIKESTKKQKEPIVFNYYGETKAIYYSNASEYGLKNYGLKKTFNSNDTYTKLYGKQN